MRPAYLRCVLALDHLVLAACGLWLALAAAPAPAAGLYIGAATADITPDRPVPLTGNTSVAEFRGVEGYEDHAVHMRARLLSADAAGDRGRRAG